MSGIVGHVMYALLGAQEAIRRELPLTRVIARHLPSYVAGAYVGSDVQTLPAGICLESGTEVGYSSMLPDRSPITGGPVQPYRLAFEGQSFTPREVHTMFYGRAHLIFGFGPAEAHLAVPWAQLPTYGGAALADTAALFPEDAERSLSYVLGWLAHVVGDSLIKSRQPGIELHLLNGKYTPENRPIQDLVTYHEVGIREMGLDWPRLLHALRRSPVEPAQAHYMRVARPAGTLAELFPEGWLPDRHRPVMHVFAENRRSLETHISRWLAEMGLRDGAPGTHSDTRQDAPASPLTYQQMREMAEAAGFRAVLQRIGEIVADVFEAAIAHHPPLRKLGEPCASDGPLTLETLLNGWRLSPAAREAHLARL